MASSRHAGHAGPRLSGRCASARHQGERTSTSRQTCCPLRFPRCAGSSGVSSGQGRPIPVASSLGRTGDDDTSSAPDDHTGPAEREPINPGCSTKADRRRTPSAEPCTREKHRIGRMHEITTCIDRSVTLTGNTVVHASGTIEGDLTVPANTRLDLQGTVDGDLIVEQGGTAVVRGTILGTLFNEGGQVEVCRGAAVAAVRDASEAKTQIAPGALVAN